MIISSLVLVSLASLESHVEHRGAQAHQQEHHVQHCEPGVRDFKRNVFFEIECDALRIVFGQVFVEVKNPI